MKMHMATPEACFQATSADECINLIYQWMPPSSPFCNLLLREAIETVCLETMTPETQGLYSQLGPLNLFAIVSGEYRCRKHSSAKVIVDRPTSYPLHDLPAPELVCCGGSAHSHPQWLAKLDRNLGGICFVSICPVSSWGVAGKLHNPLHDVEAHRLCALRPRILVVGVPPHGSFVGSAHPATRTSGGSGTRANLSGSPEQAKIGGTNFGEVRPNKHAPGERPHHRVSAIQYISPHSTTVKVKFAARLELGAFLGSTAGRLCTIG